MKNKISLAELSRAIVKKHIREATDANARPEDDNEKMKNPHKNEPEAPPKPAALPAAPNEPGDAPTSGDTPASQQAHKLNLQGKPFGNFADNTGNVVAKSVDGGQHLVKLEPKDTAKITAKDTEPNYDPYAKDAVTTLKGKGSTGNFELTDINAAMLKTAILMKDARKRSDQTALADLDKKFSVLAAKKRELEKTALMPKTSAPKMTTLLKTRQKQQGPQKFASTADADAARKTHDAELDAAYKTKKPQEPSSKLGDMVPPEIKNAVRDTTAFSRAANPTDDMNKKIDKSLADDGYEYPPEPTDEPNDWGGDVSDTPEGERYFDNPDTNPDEFFDRDDMANIEQSQAGIDSAKQALAPFKQSKGVQGLFKLLNYEPHLDDKLENYGEDDGLVISPETNARIQKAAKAVQGSNGNLSAEAWESIAQAEEAMETEIKLFRDEMYEKFRDTRWD